MTCSKKMTSSRRLPGRIVLLWAMPTMLLLFSSPLAFAAVTTFDAAQGFPETANPSAAWRLGTSADMDFRTASVWTMPVKSASSAGGSDEVTWRSLDDVTGAATIGRRLNEPIVMRAACNGSVRGNMSWLVWTASGVTGAGGYARIQGSFIEALEGRDADSTSTVYLILMTEGRRQQLFTAASSGSVVRTFAFDANVTAGSTDEVAIVVGVGTDHRCTSATRVNVTIAFEDDPAAAVARGCAWDAPRCATTTLADVGTTFSGAGASSTFPTFDLSRDWSVVSNPTTFGPSLKGNAPAAARWSAGWSRRFDFHNVTLLNVPLAVQRDEGWTSAACSFGQVVRRFPSDTDAGDNSNVSLVLHPCCGTDVVPCGMTWIQWWAPRGGTVRVSMNWRRPADDGTGTVYVFQDQRDALFAKALSRGDNSLQLSVVTHVQPQSSIDVVIDVGTDTVCYYDGVIGNIVVEVIDQRSGEEEELDSGPDAVAWMTTAASARDGWAAPVFGYAPCPNHARRCDVAMLQSAPWPFLPSDSLTESNPSGSSDLQLLPPDEGAVQFVKPQADDLVALPATALFFDFAKEFSIASNPTRSWSYGWLPAWNHSDFHLLTAVGQIENFDAWGDAARPNSARVLRTLSLASYFSPLVAGDCIVLPGENGDRGVVRWTAPSAGIVRGTVRAWHGSTRRKDPTVLMTVNAEGQLFRRVPPFQHSYEAAVSIGSTLDVIVDWGNDGNNADDHTGITHNITLFLLRPNTTDGASSLSSIDPDRSTVAGPSLLCGCPHGASACEIVERRGPTTAVGGSNASSTKVLLLHYDAVPSFSTLQNPNGAWSYGSSPSDRFASESFLLYDRYRTTDVDAWGSLVRGSVFMPLSSPIARTLPGELALITGCPAAGGSNVSEAPRLRWVAPAAGWVEVNGTTHAGDIVFTLATVVVSRDPYGTRFQRLTLPTASAAGTFHFAIHVTANDTIDLIVSQAAKPVTSCVSTATVVTMSVTLAMDDPGGIGAAAFSSRGLWGAIDQGNVTRSTQRLWVQDATPTYGNGSATKPRPGLRSLGSDRFAGLSARSPAAVACPFDAIRCFNGTAEYDAADDFSLVANPNGPWSYGHLPAFDYKATLTLHRDTSTADVSAQWYTIASAEASPSVAFNPSTKDSFLDAGPQRLGMSSRCIKVNTSTVMSTIRWTSPGNGTARITGSVGDHAGSQSVFAVVLNGEEPLWMASNAVASVSLTPRNVTLLGDVAANDTIDVVLIPRDNCVFTFTPVELHITLRPLSPPGSFTSLCPFRAHQCRGPNSSAIIRDERTFLSTRRQRQEGRVDGGVSGGASMAPLPSLPTVAVYHSGRDYNFIGDASTGTSAPSNANPWSYGWTPARPMVLSLQREGAIDFFRNFSRSHPPWVMLHWYSNRGMVIMLNLNRVADFGTRPFQVSLRPICADPPEAAVMRWTALGNGIVTVTGAWLPGQGSGNNAVIIFNNTYLMRYVGLTSAGIAVFNYTRWVSAGSTIDFRLGPPSGTCAVDDLATELEVTIELEYSDRSRCPFDAPRCPDGVAEYSLQRDFSVTKNPIDGWAFLVGSPGPPDESTSVDSTGLLNVTFHEEATLTLGWTGVGPKLAFPLVVVKGGESMSAPWLPLEHNIDAPVVMHMSCALHRPVVKWTAPARAMLRAFVAFLDGDPAPVRGHVRFISRPPPTAGGGNTTPPSDDTSSSAVVTVVHLNATDDWHFRSAVRQGDAVEASITASACSNTATPLVMLMRAFDSNFWHDESRRAPTVAGDDSNHHLKNYDLKLDFPLSVVDSSAAVQPTSLSAWSFLLLDGAGESRRQWHSSEDEGGWVVSKGALRASATRFFGLTRRVSDGVGPGEVLVSVCMDRTASGAAATSLPAANVTFTAPVGGMASITGRFSWLKSAVLGGNGSAPSSSSSSGSLVNLSAVSITLFPSSSSSRWFCLTAAT